MIVVIVTRTAPRNSRFSAPPLVLVSPASAAVPKTWNLVLIWGSTTCQSTATAAIVTIAPTM